MLKIIIDPINHNKWLINEDGIKKKDFYGACGWQWLFDNKCQPRTLSSTYNYLKGQLILQGNEFPRFPNDVVRNLTTEEYIAVSKLLQYFKIKYNKKTNKFTWQK